MASTTDHADAGWDDYAERVLRNEARLEGLENLVSETRESDRKLIEQRSESLAQELERRADALLELVTARADAVLNLSKEERNSDRREVELITDEIKDRLSDSVEDLRHDAKASLDLLRELYDTAIKKNYEQSHDAIRGLEQRMTGKIEKLEQMVQQWRESDREARDLYSSDVSRHLEQLNHANERIAAFQANSVTRELWQSEKDASIKREGLLRDQIITLEKTMLGMTPVSISDRNHAELREYTERAVSSAHEVLSNKIGVVDDKVADLKSYRDTTQGRSSGYTAFYGWAVALVSLMIGAIVGANAIFGR